MLMCENNISAFLHAEKSFYTIVHYSRLCLRKMHREGFFLNIKHCEHQIECCQSSNDTELH